MFVFSFRANKPKIIITLGVLTALLVGILIFLSFKDSPVLNSDLSAKASNEDERIAFLSQYGWKIEEDPIEVSEVIIPSEFNETYSAYNEIQKTQSMDLEAYKGQRVKKWVYEIKNYPGYPAESDCIRATILVLDGMVIGGDISSIEADGFMQGFEFPEDSTTQATSQVS